VDPTQLSKSLESEHPQTVALVLAHLDLQRGSQVLTGLGEEQRVAAVQRLAEMRHFSPEVAQKVARISQSAATDRRGHAETVLLRLQSGRGSSQWAEAEAAKRYSTGLRAESPETAIHVRQPDVYL